MSTPSSSRSSANRSRSNWRTPSMTHPAPRSTSWPLRRGWLRGSTVPTRDRSDECHGASITVVPSRSDRSATRFAPCSPPPPRVVSHHWPRSRRSTTPPPRCRGVSDSNGPPTPHRWPRPRRSAVDSMRRSLRSPSNASASWRHRCCLSFAVAKVRTVRCSSCSNTTNVASAMTAARTERARPATTATAARYHALELTLDTEQCSRPALISAPRRGFELLYTRAILVKQPIAIGGRT